VTTTTTVPPTVKDLDALVEAAPEGSPLALVGPPLVDALYEWFGLEAAMRDALRRIDSDLETARFRLRGGLSLDPDLFHHRPIEFDRMCAQRADAMDNIQRLVRAINNGTDAEPLWAEQSLVEADVLISDVIRQIHC